jgi:ComF family protein
MQDLNLFDGLGPTAEKGFARGTQALSSDWLSWPGGQDVGRGHCAQITHAIVQGRIAKLDPINVDDRIVEAGGPKELREAGGLDAGMHVRRCLSGHCVRSQHRPAKERQALTAGDRADEQAIVFQDPADVGGGERQGVGGVEETDAQAKVEATPLQCHGFEIGLGPSGALGHKRARIDDGHLPGDPTNLFSPVRVGAPGDQDLFERPGDLGEPLQAVLEGAIEEEAVQPLFGRPVPAKGAKTVIEQWSTHKALVRRGPSRNKSGMGLAHALAGGGRWVIDLALPPRCPGCGVITGELHSFCVECWRSIEWLGEGGCGTCGLPLEGTDLDICAACLASPPLIARTRAAVAYGDITRTLPLRLKYSRKVALAKTMARYMLPLIALDEDPLLVPVPLHRSRLWSRGFNQSALIARELARHCAVGHDPYLLRRLKRTAALKGMGPRQRRLEVRGAFAVARPDALKGKAVVLVDDVLTSGSTADACAKAVMRAGARRVELVCWARVVRPTQLVR